MIDTNAQTVTWRPVESEEVRTLVRERVLEVANRLRDLEQVRAHGKQLEQEAAAQGWPFRWMDTDNAHGLAGISMLFGALDHADPEAEWDVVGHQFLSAVQQALQQGITNSSVGLIGGLAGVGMSVQVLSRGGTRYQNFVEQFHHLLIKRYQTMLPIAEQNLTTGVSPFDYDVVVGMAGIGRYFLLNIDKPEMREALCEVLTYLVRLSEEKLVGDQMVPGWYVPPKQQHLKREMIEHPNGHFDLGLAHGIPGPLALMALALRQRVEVPGQREAMRRIVDFLLDWRQVDQYGSRWPAKISWEEFRQRAVKADSGLSRAAWCYGTPGVARTLWLAGEALGEEAWKQLALEAYQAIFLRPEETWRAYAPTLCHGYAGLLIITQRMYSESGAEELAVARNRLLDKVLSMYKEEIPYGFYGAYQTKTSTEYVDFPGCLEGAAGAALVLQSLLRDEAPEWDAMLVIA